MKIINIDALQILDSRGNPTLQVSVILDDGSKGTFQVPSGASTGIYEALELRDNNKEVYHGKAVTLALEHVDAIKNDLYGRDFTQKELDDFLITIDGTDNKGSLGANTILGISIAFAKACAIYYNLSLHEYLYRLNNGISFTNKTNAVPINPILFSNIINGGLHSGNKLNIQEFMIIPVMDNLKDNVRAVSEIYHTLKDIIAKKYSKQSTAVGDEGGFAPNISKTKDALSLLTKAIEECGYTGKIKLAMDAAASDFYDKETKMYEVEHGFKLTKEQLIIYYNELVDDFPIISIEDPFAEEDYDAFKKFKKEAKKLNEINPLTGKRELLIVGDDLLVTNPTKVKYAIKEKLCNSLLLKINQIGTLSESLEAYRLAKDSGWHVIVSHRSGETTDSFIADLSVALNSSIKIGAPARGERVAKYNRLLEIYK